MKRERERRGGASVNSPKDSTLSLGLASTTHGTFDHSQDSTFALTERVSFKKKETKISNRGKTTSLSYTRHTTGITQQEHVKRDQRFQADDLYITGAEALKEHVLDEILSHRIDIQPIDKSDIGT